jgi:hypothetical protein
VRAATRHNHNTTCDEHNTTRKQIGTHESFSVRVDPRFVGNVSLNDPASCIRMLSTVRGALVRLCCCVRCL